MINVKSRVLQVNIFLVCIAIFLASGCAFTPKPVFIAERPSSLDVSQKKNVRLALIVKDTRPDPVQNARICGLVRNSYMIPTSFAFLAHKAKLDEIVAAHVKNNLEHSGYDVTKTYPFLTNSLADKIEAPPGEESENKKAFKGMGDPNREDLEKARDKKDVAEVEAIDGLAASAGPWIEESLAKDVDAIVEVKIDKYSSDFIQSILWVSVQGWSRFKVAVNEPKSDQRNVLWGKTVTGYGTSGPRAAASEDCWIMAVNMAHWTAMQEMEKLFRSDEFYDAIKRKLVLGEK